MLNQFILIIILCVSMISSHCNIYEINKEFYIKQNCFNELHINMKKLIVNDTSYIDKLKVFNDTNYIKVYPYIKYGYYCGIYHYDIYGRKPMDILDDACQIHDICTTRGLTDCYCNQQLYYRISNIKPLNKSMSEARDSMARYIFLVIYPCSNSYEYDKRYVIGTMNNNGFNYLPLYKKNETKEFIIETEKPIYLIKLCNDYEKFTRDVYNNTINFRRYGYTYLNGTSKITLIKDCDYVLYNYNIAFAEFKLINVKKICNSKEIINDCTLPYLLLSLTIGSLCCVSLFIYTIIRFVCLRNRSLFEK